MVIEDNEMGKARLVEDMRYYLMMRILSTVVLAIVVMAVPISLRAEAPSREIYLSRCASCHGTNGRGDGPSIRWLRTQPTNFHDCGVMRKLSDETIFAAIKYGTGILDLPADMPGFFNRLSDREISDMDSYIRQFCRAGLEK